MRKTIEERFWKYVDKRGPDDCWLFAKTNNTGYGRITKGGVKYLAHRFSWELHHGPISGELFVLHCCESRYAPGDQTCRRCVNPRHLRLGTPKENTADMKNAGRGGWLSGDLHGKTRLSDADAKAVVARNRAGETTNRIHEDYRQVSLGTIRNVCYGGKRRRLAVREEGRA